MSEDPAETFGKIDSFIGYSDFSSENDYCCCHIELQNCLGALRKYDTQEFYSKIINHLEKYGVI